MYFHLSICFWALLRFCPKPLPTQIAGLTESRSPKAACKKAAFGHYLLLSQTGVSLPLTSAGRSAAAAAVVASAAVVPAAAAVSAAAYH